MTAYNPYDLQQFIDSVKDLDWHEIVKTASDRRHHLQNISFSRKGAPRAREMGSVQLATQLTALLSWLGDFQKPLGLSDGHFAAFRVICENLVQKGQVKPDALAVFGPRTEDL